jgi:hypothetical protein
MNFNPCYGEPIAAYGVPIGAGVEGSRGRHFRQFGWPQKAICARAPPVNFVRTSELVEEPNEWLVHHQPPFSIKKVTYV